MAVLHANLWTVWDQLGGKNEKDKNKPRASSYVTQPCQLEPLSVNMWLQSGEANTEADHIHTFASTDHLPLTSNELDLNQVHDWQQEYPELAHLFKAGRPDGDVVLAESLLDMPNEKPSGMLTQHARLTIENRFKVSRTVLTPGTIIRTSLTFFVNGDLDEPLSGAEPFSFLECQADDKAATVLIPLGSSHWVRLLSAMWHENEKKRRAFNMRHQKADDLDLCQEMRDSVVCTLRDITIVQDVFKMRKLDSGDDGEWIRDDPPLLTICWRFDAAPLNTRGRTVCRRVILPAHEVKTELDYNEEGDWEQGERDLPNDWQSLADSGGVMNLYNPLGLVMESSETAKPSLDQHLTLQNSYLLQTPEDMLNEQTNGGVAEAMSFDNGNLLPLDPSLATESQAQIGFPSAAMLDPHLAEAYHDHHTAFEKPEPLLEPFFDMNEDCLPGSSASAMQQVQGQHDSHYATMSSLRTTLQPHSLPYNRNLPLRLATGSCNESYHPGTNASTHLYTQSHISSAAEQPGLESYTAHSVPEHQVQVANMSDQTWSQETLQQAHAGSHLNATQQASQAYQQYIHMPHILPAQLDDAPAQTTHTPVHEHRYETRHKQRTQEMLPSQLTIPQGRLLPSQPMTEAEHDSLPSSFNSTGTDNSYDILSQRRASYATTVSTTQSSCFESTTPAPTTAATESFDFATQHFPGHHLPNDAGDPLITSTQSSPGKPASLSLAQADAMTMAEGPRSARPDFHFGESISQQQVTMRGEPNLFDDAVEQVSTPTYQTSAKNPCSYIHHCQRAPCHQNAILTTNPAARTILTAPPLPLLRRPHLLLPSQSPNLRLRPRRTRSRFRSRRSRLPRRHQRRRHRRSTARTPAFGRHSHWSRGRWLPPRRCFPAS